MSEYSAERQQMIDEQLRRRGINDQRVLAAMAQIPRHRFLGPSLEQQAYKDSALPIASGQTISQPFIVALTAQEMLLQPDDCLLEVGTGSGYAAAVFSRLVKQVYTVERYGKLAEEARQRFQQLGYRNIEVLVTDGSHGWREHAPYNAIAVAAAAPQVPQPLLEQLAEGGRLVLPIGNRDEQWLVRLTRRQGRVSQQRLCPVRFVPLVGDWGWEAPLSPDAAS